MRVFIAIDLPDEIKKKIDGFQKEISPSVSLRMVPLKNLHLTLVFLGEISEYQVDSIIQIVKEVAAKTGLFNLCLGKPEFFPKWGKPRGLWIGIEGQTEKLEKLQQNLTNELKMAQFVLERQHFSAHVTVGRIKGKNERLEFASFSKAEFTVNSITVFSSKLTPKGPIYSKLETIPLE